MHWHGDGTAFTAPQFLSMASGDQVSILKLFQAEEIELAQILVLGAGIAGMPAAYALKSQLGPKDDVTVVSDQDHFHFVPSNPWVAMGWRKRPDISIPLAPCLDARGIRFIGSGVQALQPEKNQVLLDNGETLSYDYLLIATGVEGNFDETISMKCPVSPAMPIRCSTSGRPRTPMPPMRRSSRIRGPSL